MCGKVRVMDEESSCVGGDFTAVDATMGFSSQCGSFFASVKSKD